MKMPQYIRIELLSDTTFSRGECTAGVVDVDVDHDDLGLPFLGGKALRGLLHDSWLSMAPSFKAYKELQYSAERILGKDFDLAGSSILRIGDAVVDAETRRWIEGAEYRKEKPVSSSMVLQALTDIRYQTAEERKTGAPAKTTLRSVRVLLRTLTLDSPLCWLDNPSTADYCCLALMLLATRHAGLGRNRGRGHIRLTLNGDAKVTVRIAKGDVL
jgi:hypothetical protein